MRMGTMVDVEETISVAEAAERLGISGEDAYMLVFSKKLRSIEAPSGRRLIPVDAVDEWLRTHPVSA
jgi:excisionase family DNA binding protein